MRTLLLLSCALLAACSSTGPIEMSDEDRLEVYRETALYHYELGDIDRAEHQALKGLDIERDDTVLRLMVGWIRLRRGTTDDLIIAKGIFRELEREEGDYRAALGLAEALERLGKAHAESSEAVAAGERPVAGDAAQRAAELDVEAQTHWDEAEALYRDVVEARPGNLKATNGLQRLAIQRGRYGEALEWAQQLLDVTNAELDAWNRQLERPNLTTAEEDRLRENRLSSAELALETHLTAAWLLRRLDRLEDALPHLEEAVAMAPATPSIYSRRAQLLGELGHYERALQDIEKYLRSSSEGYDHPDIQHAFELKRAWEAKL